MCHHHNSFTVDRVGDRTLTATEIDPIHNKIREALVEEFNVTLRI